MKQTLTTREEKNRKHLLKRIRSVWINGVLEQSLNNTTLIALRLYSRPDAISNPWRLVMQESKQQARALPAGTHIIDVYDDSDGELLILGEPGAGKTTLLLELARDLLNRIEQDETYLMPIVLNLSSWAEKRLPLSTWLIEELETKYQVPRSIGTGWVHADQIILLLDGLDEVASAHRTACVNAINAYRREHPLVSLVVCSRIAEYQDQTILVALHSAIVVQPLTVQQIDEYLAHAGELGAEVRAALGDDPILQELVTTPLMLNVLILAYQEKSLNDLIAVSSSDTKQQQIFEAYVQRMLSRGSFETRYTFKQTKQWLARQMRQRSQAIFYIEQMQPNWLSERQWQRIYESLAIRLPDILIGVLVSLLVVNMFFSFVLGVTDLLRFGILGGLIGGLISRQETAGSLAESNSHFWRNLWHHHINGSYLRNGLIVGLIFIRIGGVPKEES
jgi:hypothetical protein